ncbi:MAG: crotonase/enoyl-CoA hydratase family protein [Hyphomicrobiales bacterium]|nr:crotonase/enoyl-CoA hydratase family protein [Hyphomicrobiales bacterium]
MQDRISIDIVDGVADVRLVRADKMNALDEKMFDALIEAGESLRATGGLRAVVLSGEGRAFCAGLDMGRMEAMKEKGEGLAGLRDLVTRVHGDCNRPQQAVMTWRRLPVPVIAAVHGVAFGGGFQVALGADMRYAAPDTRFSVMEIRWGLVPDMGGIVLMSKLARDDIVRELTYTGAVFSAEEALAYGFVTRICADPRASALETARAIALKSPTAIRAAKALIGDAAGQSEAEILLAESHAQQAAIGSANQIEAVRAQMEKRAPRFTEG